MRAILLTGCVSCVVTGSILALGASQSVSSKLTFDGETAIVTVAIRPDKTSDFESLIGRLQEGLRKSTNPLHQQQSAGWKVIRVAKPLPDGNIAYAHLIDPVVSGADYGLLAVLSELYPKEAKAMVELYREAFAASLSTTVGNAVKPVGGMAAPR